jgi:RimJ/RimL family protein N-acetyltransferase
MRLNENTVVEGSKCSLVPYTKEFVEQYHAWFVADPSLLETTGSELLTLEEEYENQESWRTDETKLTFLIVDNTLPGKPLCGDINCFFSDFEKDQFIDDEVESNTQSTGCMGEINLMIAEKQSRRKGIAQEALRLFIDYMKAQIPNFRALIAKIQTRNDPSIKLFEKMGFVEFKRVECFQEIHYVLKIDPSCF